MKGGKQKISKDTCQQTDRAEPEVYAGGQTYIRITENNFTNAEPTDYGLLEQILSPTNMNQAYKKVKGNKGRGGKDKMEVESLDMDLEKFFDTVNQSKLIEVLSRTVKDGRVISLIHKYLHAGVVVRNKFEETNVGVPQGGPLSPLLSNIMLNELDKELERRGHHFVRYADDLIILCTSKRSSERTLANIIPYIEEKLFLKVNREKTAVAYISGIKFLGYSFYENEKGGRLRAHPNSIARMRERVRTLTSRNNGWGDARRKEELRQYITGWVNYFKLGDIKSLLLHVDEWYRRRLRMIIWKQWKRVRTRLRNLIMLGIAKFKAREYANTRKSYWHTANSPILTRTIANDRLQKAGYIFFSDYYRKVHA